MTDSVHRDSHSLRQDVTGEGPISLDELAKAFAQVMGPSAGRQSSETPPTLAEAATQSGRHLPLSRQPTLAIQDEPAEDEPGPVAPLGILEAMLFVGDRDNQPLTAARAAELMRGVEPGEIGGLIDDLNRRYSRNGCPYFIEKNADGYRMTLRKPFHPLRERFYSRIREARLSQAAIDVLAIVAYQQPLSADQIAAVRGRPSGGVLSQLVHRGLLRIERLPAKRQLAQYFTTDRFLRLFGLQSLADLPQSEELDRQ